MHKKSTYPQSWVTADPYTAVVADAWPTCNHFIINYVKLSLNNSEMETSAFYGFMAFTTMSNISQVLQASANHLGEQMAQTAHWIPVTILDCHTNEQRWYALFKHGQHSFLGSW